MDLGNLQASFAVKDNISHSNELTFQTKDGETPEQAAQGSCGCPIPGSVQGQAGWGSEQPGLVEGVPAHGRDMKYLI